MLRILFHVLQLLFVPKIVPVPLRVKWEVRQGRSVAARVEHDAVVDG